MKQQPRVFVSYRRDDSAYVTTPIYDRLVQALGADNVFMDVDNIPAGRDFRVHLQMAINACDVCVAVIGEGWLGATNPDGTRRLDDESDFVRLEIEASLGRDIPVIPLLVGRAQLPTAAQLPESLVPLTYRQALRIRPGSDYRRDVQELLDQILDVDASTRRSAADASAGTAVTQAGPVDERSPGAVGGPLPILRQLAAMLVARPALAVTLALLWLFAASLFEVLLDGAEASETTSSANWTTMLRPLRYVVYASVGIWLLIALRSWLAVLRPDWRASSRRSVAIGLAFLGAELTTPLIRFVGFGEGFFGWLPWGMAVQALLVFGAVAHLERQLRRGAVGVAPGLGGFAAAWLAFAAFVHFVDGTHWALAFVLFTPPLLILICLAVIEGRLAGDVVEIAPIEPWRARWLRSLLGVLLAAPLGLVAYLWAGKSFGDAALEWFVVLGSVAVAITAIALLGGWVRTLLAGSSAGRVGADRWFRLERGNAVVYLLFLLVAHSLAPLLADSKSLLPVAWKVAISWLAESLPAALVGVLARASWSTSPRPGAGARQDWLGCAFAVGAAFVVHSLYLKSSTGPLWLLSPVWAAHVYWSMSVLPPVAAARFLLPASVASRRKVAAPRSGKPHAEAVAKPAAEATEAAAEPVVAGQISAGELRGLNVLRSHATDSWQRVRQATPEPGLVELLQEGDSAFQGLEKAYGSRAYAAARTHGEQLARVCEQIREIEARRELAGRERARALALQAKAKLFEAKRLAATSWQAAEHFLTVAETSFRDARFELAGEHWREARRELAGVVQQAQALRRLEVKAFVAGIAGVLDGSLGKDEARSVARSLADANELSTSQATALIRFTKAARKNGGKVMAHEAPEATLCELLAGKQEVGSGSGAGVASTRYPVLGWILLALYVGALLLTLAADVSFVTGEVADLGAWLIASRIAAIGATILTFLAMRERASGRLLAIAAIVCFGLVFANLGVFTAFAGTLIIRSLWAATRGIEDAMSVLHVIGLASASVWIVWFAIRMRTVAARSLLESMSRWITRCGVVCAAALVGHTFFTALGAELPLGVYWEVTLLGSTVVAALPSAALWVGRRLGRLPAATGAEPPRSAAFVATGVAALGGAVAWCGFGLHGTAVGVGYFIVAFTLIALASVRTADALPEDGQESPVG